jgi:two-component system OmpR family response regulator/two-component system response regulator RstA
LLLARIKALLRRGTEKDGLRTRTFGQFRIDSQSRTVTIANKIVAMSVNEFDVLWLLASQAGKVISRDDLVSQLRGIDYDGFDRSIDIRISRIRKKLEDNPEQPAKIKTVRGRGYLFVSDVW